MAAHSSILAWRTPRTEEPGGLRSRGSQRADTTEQQQLSVDIACRSHAVTMGACLSFAFWAGDRAQMELAGLAMLVTVSLRTRGQVSERESKGT